MMTFEKCSEYAVYFALEDLTVLSRVMYYCSRCYVGVWYGVTGKLCDILIVTY
jgi:hypothetical protein